MKTKGFAPWVWSIIIGVVLLLILTIVGVAVAQSAGESAASGAGGTYCDVACYFVRSNLAADIFYGVDKCGC